jgi:tetratricopeptide (TPR) repeat protein
LLQIPIEWMAKSDPPFVKRCLSDYGNLDAAQREATAGRLAVLPDGEGVDAVCRLVRFEKSALLSKAAATALLPRGQAALPVPQATLDAIRKRLGGCRRPGAVWLGVLARFGTDPAAAAAEWSRLAESEYELWRQAPSKTSTEVVSCLLRFQVAWLNKLGKAEQSARALERLIYLEDNGDAESLGDLAQWLVDRKAWSGLDELTRRFSARCDRDARLLYLLAEAQAGQGRSKQAEETALRAFRIAARQPSDPDEDSPHPLAAWLRERGRFAWARREFARVIAAGDRPSAGIVEQRAAVTAGFILSEMLHDQGEDLDAAKALERVVARLDSISAAGAPGAQPVNSDLAQNHIRATMHYYLACHWEARHDAAKQRACLDKAGRADPENPDVLIARYRLPDEPRGYHAEAVEAVERAALTIHGRIPSNPESTVYNNYAWLIGNTEGDFDEAVKCSFKSIELAPEEGGLYDTLGHVYFGKGDWEKAVKYQAIAAELDPHSGLIQRALTQFRKKLKESKK